MVDDVIEKIKKLLALASNPAAAPNEAETASRQAAKLMAKYQLDEADIAQAQGREMDFDLVSGAANGNRPGKKNGKKVPTWINMIQYGVKFWTRTYTRLGTTEVVFQGPRQDVELAIWLHNYLVEQCYRTSQGRSISDAAQFRIGYAGAIQSRLKKMAKDRDEVDTELESSGTSLVIVKTKLESAMRAAFGGPGRTVSIRAKASDEGRLAGQSAHIPVNRPVSGRGRTALPQ